MYVSKECTWVSRKELDLYPIVVTNYNVQYKIASSVLDKLVINYPFNN